jgi:hypothetical protein
MNATQQKMRTTLLCNVFSYGMIDRLLLGNNENQLITLRK